MASFPYAGSSFMFHGILSCLEKTVASLNSYWEDHQVPSHCLLGVYT